MKTPILSLLVAVGLIYHGWAQSTEQIKSSEAELNKAYKEAREKMPPAQKAQLKQDEINWINKRDIAEANSNKPQETHLKLTLERIRELQKLKLESKNSALLYQKDFYSPSDKFPSDPRGIKIIGKFIAIKDSIDGSIYLKADKSKGEKDVGRIFQTKNFQPNAGDSLEFNKYFPLYIASKSMLGIYDVTVQQQPTPQPSKVSAGESPNNLIKHEINGGTISERKLIADAMNTEIRKSYKDRFSQPVIPFSGFGNIPWGSTLQESTLGGDIDPRGDIIVTDFYNAYSATENQNTKSIIELEQQELSVIDNYQHLMGALDTGFIISPTVGIVSGVSGNRVLTYFCSNNKLVGVGISPLKDAVPMDPPVILEAMKQKYGTPTISKVNIENNENTVFKWSNDIGTVVLIIGHKSATKERMMQNVLEMATQQQEQDELNKGNIGNVIALESGQGKAAKELVGSLLGSSEADINKIEAQYEVAEILYYSNQGMVDSQSRVASLRSKLEADIQQLQNQQIKNDAAKVINQY